MQHITTLFPSFSGILLKRLRMESMKNRRKRDLFRCFKSNDAVDPQKAKTKDPLLSYIALAEKQGTVLPTILSSVKGCAGEGSANRRRKNGRESSLRIRQALIAALNNTSLGKKIINRRKTNKTYCRSRINKLVGESDSISNTEPKIPDKTNSYPYSHCSSAFTPSSLSSSIASSSSQASQFLGLSTESNLHPLSSIPRSGIGDTKKKQDVGETRKGRYFDSNMVVSLVFLASLLVLILWGKLFAVLCTSIGFFMIPLGHRKFHNED